MVLGAMSSWRSAARRQTIGRRRAVALALLITLIGAVAIASSQHGGGAAGSASRRAQQGVLAARAQRAPGCRGRVGTNALWGLRPGSDPSVLPGPVLIADSDNNRLLEVDPRGHVLWRFPAPGDLAPARRSACPMTPSFRLTGIRWS